MKKDPKTFSQYTKICDGRDTVSCDIIQSRNTQITICPHHWFGESSHFIKQ